MKNLLGVIWLLALLALLVAACGKVSDSVDGGDSDSDSDSNSDSDADGDCSESISGIFNNDVSAIQFDSVNVEYVHKRDVDLVEDGCISTVNIFLTANGGCRLRVSAGNIFVDEDPWTLQITDVEFSADSFCPGFLGADEGVYSGISGLSVATVEIGLWEIPEQRAEEATIHLPITVRLQGTLSSTGSKTLAIETSAITVSGCFISTGEGSAACPELCTPAVYQQCGTDGNVHSFDSCDNQGALVEECESCAHCVNTSETDAECQPAELQSVIQCGTGGDVSWFDSCGVEGAVVTDCAADETCVNEGAAAAYCSVSSCTGKADFMRCAVKTTPDRSYDICINGSCQSPGCGTVDCNAPGPHFPIPDTNQRVCSDDGTSGEIPCPASGEPYFGQDAQYGWDVTHAANLRFTRDTSTANQPVVTDNVTTLVWQGCAARLQGNDCTEHHPAVTGNYAGSFTWAYALAYCDSLDWGGFTDWRLPDEFELYSIVDFGRTRPSIDTAAFPATPDYGFWTSSSNADNTTYAWSVNFGIGNFFEGYGPKAGYFHARCVRGGPSGAARFARSTTTANQPVVTDNVTTLVWQGCAAGLQGNDCTEDDPAVTGTGEAEFAWADTLVYCENLTWGGTSDWRLPSVKELMSIVDHSRFNPAIDITAFPATPSSTFWTSSSRANYTTDAWLVYFSYGDSDTAPKPNTYLARCVRGGP